MVDSRTWGYARCSSSSQNEDRQIQALIESGVDSRFILTDFESGKDFNREQYQILKKALRENDVLVIKSIDRLGRNYNMILEEWRDITKNIKADIRVLDMPILDTSKYKDLLGKVINDIILALLSYVAEQERTYIRSRQREGIDLYLKTKKTKTGRPYGRPTIPIPTEWATVIAKWKNNEITGRQAQKELGLKPNKFYRLLKEEKIERD